MLLTFYLVLAALIAAFVFLTPKGRKPAAGASAAQTSEPAPAPAENSADAISLPLAGLRPSELRDSFSESRGGHRHEAIDILAPRGTPVLAVDDGTVRKIFESAPGGHTVYEFNRDETLCYYYAHLDGYARGLTEGQVLRRGDLIGYVGTTGNAPPNTPHLHFAISRLGPDKHWWQGVPIDPYPILSRPR
ncbi:MAG: M23 family metallopeptidase [Thermoanaerobaculia bacterium]